MKKLCLLGLFVSLASHNVLAATTPAPLENKDAFISNPVSYTHLTLPTIYSV